jgi:transcriptional regulator with XRE-family HTH domain
MRARRLDLGLHQKDVAAQIICTVDTITNWELNRCQPELPYIPRIIKFLGYDPFGPDKDEPLGQRLRKHRRRLGLSLKQAAALLEVDPTSLRDWETGRHRPTNKSRSMIDKFLSWTLERFTSAELPIAAAMDPDLEAVARIWRGGCIIRAALLEDICAAFRASPKLPNLLLDPNLSRQLMEHQEDLRQVICQAAESGVPAPGLMVSLSYLAYRSAWLPANLIQARRDYFGAHTYERIDAKGTFHTQWEKE